MNHDCHWLASHVEDFFCERLSAEDQKAAVAHIESCPKCRAEIQGFEKVDGLVKAYFRHQLQDARRPHPRPAFGLSYRTAAVALASVIVVALVLWVPQIGRETFPERAGGRLQEPSPAEPAPGVKEQAEISKLPEKPQPAETRRESEIAGELKASSASPASATGPEFMVVDPAGYSHSLADYRGSVLLVGVWNTQLPESIQNLQKLYESFGENPKLKILGVSTKRRPKPRGTTFPYAFNQGSRLFDARPTQFVIIDGDGVVRFRGSLLGDPSTLIENVRGMLEQVGIR